MRLSNIFITVTAAVIILATATSFIYINKAKEQAPHNGRSAYTSIVIQWTQSFKLSEQSDNISERQLIIQSTRQFIEWLNKMAEQDESIISVTIGKDDQKPLIRWVRNNARNSTNTLLLFSDRSVKLPQNDQRLRIQMEYNYLNAPVFRQIAITQFLIIGIYIAFLLILFLSTSSKSSSLKNNINEQNDIMNVPVASEVENSSFTRTLSDGINLAASQESEYSLIIIHLNQADYISANDWLNEHYFQKDSFFQLSKEKYAILLPGHSIKESLREGRNLAAEWPETAYAGIASRSGRLLSPDRMIHEAFAAVKKAIESGEPVVGFQPNLEKYRSFISKSMNRP